MSTTNPGSDLPVRRIDRILALSSLGLLLLSVVCFVAIIVASAVGGQDFSTGVWPTIGIVVYIAPILAFLLLLSVLIMSFVRKARRGRSR